MARSTTRSEGTEPPSFPWQNTWPEITDARVRAAFTAVPRAEFVSNDLRPFVTQDEPLPIGAGQTTSQPFVVAYMLQALNVQPGDKVLEVGAGTGFETALLCELTAAAGQPPGAGVYAVERFAELTGQAERTLHRLGYSPQLRTGDGAAGWPEQAPFTAIIVAAAAAYVPRPLWDQLVEGGRMILPVGVETWDQELWFLRKRAGQAHRTRLGGVRFVPLISPLLDDPQNRLEEFE